MRSFPVRVLAAFVAVVVLAAAPAVAIDPVEDWEAFVEEHRWDVPSELRDELLTLLLREIALLHELDAFDAPGQELATVRDAFGPLTGADRDALVDEVLTVDDQLAARKGELFDFPPIEQFVVAALDSLEEPQRQRLQRGDVQFIVTQPYTGALSTLVSEGAAKELRRIDQVGVEMGEPLDAVLIALVPESSAGDGPPLLTIAATVGASALVGAAFVAWRRRGSRRDDGASEALELTRRLTDADDEETAAEIVASGAASLAHADRGWLLRRSKDGLRVAGTQRMLVDSAVDRVVDTGQPFLGIVANDPMTDGRPAALAAVPVVSRGEVTGVVVVGRNADQPFDDDTRARLELLAPVLGSRLANIDRLDTAHTLALVDGLTSLANRRRLDGDLQTSLAAAVARDLPLAFAMVDVDHFKHFNDTNGHEAGDEALQTVARAIEETVRTSDIVYRYGGEEFSVLLPGATEAEAAAAAERIRVAVEAIPVAGEEHQPGGCLTVSVGVSTLAAGDADGLKSRADEALYEAKARGRNQSVIL